MKKIFLPILFIALAAGGWWLFRGAADVRPAQSAPNQNESAKAERRDMESTIVLTGDVTPALEVEIRPEVGGKVKSVFARAGKPVQRGDVLVEIDDTDLLTERASAEADVAGARLEVDKARRNFRRAEDLFEAKLLSREVYDNTKSELEISENNLLKSQSRLMTVEERLNKTKVFAPADGTVLSLNVIEGQVVSAAASVNSGTLLMTLADLSRLIINTHVNQVDIAHVRPDSRATFRSDAISDREMLCSINFIAPIATIKNNIKGFAVEALIEEPDPRLRPGMTVNLTVDIAVSQDAVTVPISAVFSDGDGERVVYVKHGETTERRPVTVGLTNVRYAEITSGLEPGEEVLLFAPARRRS